ncbi:hypothetical protein GCM10010430_60070 [Kitasatospora cystarginea]|uniref:Uncharacterized protein n=1 Tax=Kitasatospora cystarginea TaxID=58350 RepID=A0ABN3EQI0_9ACTN
MAVQDGRIRTHKPEMSRDPKLAEVSLSAERTFVYMLNYVDDRGRVIDDAGILRGLIWKRKKSWDGSVHTTERVEEDLRQLADVGLVCRYVNPADEGEELLHVVNFNKHQRIDKPSVSRLVPCPLHQTQEADADKPVPAKRTRKKILEHQPEQHLADVTETADQSLPESSDRDHQDPRSLDSTTPSMTPSPTGSRITDPGSTPPGGGCAAPAQVLSSEDPSADQVAVLHPHTTGANALVAEYVRSCPQQPTERFRGHLGREVKQLLSAGYGTEQVRAGLRLLAQNPKGPSALESFVQEALTSRRTRTGSAYQAWTNPAAGAAAYAGDL